MKFASGDSTVATPVLTKIVLVPAFTPVITSDGLSPIIHDCTRSILYSDDAWVKKPGFGFLQSHVLPSPCGHTKVSTISMPLGFISSSTLLFMESNFSRVISPSASPAWFVTKKTTKSKDANNFKDLIEFGRSSTFSRLSTRSYVGVPIFIVPSLSKNTAFIKKVYHKLNLYRQWLTLITITLYTSLLTYVQCNWKSYVESNHGLRV